MFKDSALKTARTMASSENDFRQTRRTADLFDSAVKIRGSNEWLSSSANRRSTSWKKTFGKSGSGAKEFRKNCQEYLDRRFDSSRGSDSKPYYTGLGLPPNDKTKKFSSNISTHSTTSGLGNDSGKDVIWVKPAIRSRSAGRVRQNYSLYQLPEYEYTTREKLHDMKSSLQNFMTDKPDYSQIKRKPNLSNLKGLDFQGVPTILAKSTNPGFIVNDQLYQWRAGDGPTENYKGKKHFINDKYFCKFPSPSCTIPKFSFEDYRQRAVKTRPSYEMLLEPKLSPSFLKMIANSGKMRLKSDTDSKLNKRGGFSGRSTFNSTYDCRRSSLNDDYRTSIDFMWRKDY